MENNIRQFNKTFNIGERHLNACVGNNGLQDLEIYGRGFDFATKSLIKSAKQEFTEIDACIYPLVFCARHRLELFLKDQLIKLKKIRENQEISEKKLIQTHDLKILWDLYKEHGKKTDKRFVAFIDEYEEFFLDFSEIDPTGETFRYPHDKMNELHLIHTPIINIAVLGKRYEALSKKLEEIEFLANYLIAEYSQNTFTKNLSREDIEDISKNLPNKDKWREETFCDIKNEFMSKYKISGRELSKALDIIKNHREFCVNIGQEIHLAEITDMDLEKFIQLYAKYNYRCNNSESINAEQLFNDINTLNECISELQKDLSKDAIICIYTLIELGHKYYFCEHYDIIYSDYRRLAADDYEFDEYCSYIFTNSRALMLIENALVKSGQTSLLTSMKEKLGSHLES